MAEVVKKNTLNFFLVLIFVCCVSFVACDNGDKNDIPERTPSGGVDGNAVDALIINGTITVFEWENGTKGAQLAQATTDENGYYSVAVQAETQPVLIQLEGGYYIEEASGVKVDLKDGQKLFCVTPFEMGSELSVMVTPWTTIAYGLTQYYYLTEGENVANAITLGTAAISTLVDVLIAKVCPQNITEDVVSSFLSDELQYGFFCAAISEWTKNISIENGHGGSRIHSYWNSIYMNQLMYRDIAVDGQLNGRGWSMDKSTVVELSMGSVLLDAQVYRKYIGLHMINAANADYNRSGLTVDDILGSALQFANRVNEIFEYSEPLPIDNTPPTITRTDAVGTVYSGLIDYQFTVKDHCGVTFVELSIGDDEPVTIVPDSTFVTLPIDTSLYDEGENELVITAEDALGNSVTTSHTLTFNNVGVSINVTSTSITNQREYRIEGTYTEVNTRLSEINLTSDGDDYSASLNTLNGTWTAALTLSNGSNSVEIEVIDNVGNVNITELIVDLDQQNPFLTNGMHSNATYKTETGLTVKQIEDNYTAEPIYIDIYNSSLNGCPVAAENLIAAEIPYFNFMVEDLPDNEVSTAPADLNVTFDFYTGGNQLVFGNVLTPISTPISDMDDEFLIPLCTEYFTDAWAQQTDTEIVNLIKVSIEDQAGNQTQKDYEFKVYFNAPVVSINSFTDNCTVVIRSFVSGIPGAIIATGTTDSDGYCGLNVATESQPIHISLSEGRYFEQSNGNFVDMESGQEITAVYNFNKADCSITVSPLTHLAAISAEHSYSAGKVDYSDAAVDSANATISQIYGVDIVNTEPLRITSFISGSTGYSDGNAYGFILAGMSRMCSDVSEANTTSGNMSYYNTVLLAQSMGIDIADGKLDGQTGSDLIYFGDPVDPYFYRNTLANAILNAVNSAQNQTGFKTIDVLDSMTGIAECGNNVYGYLHPVQMFDLHGPEVVATNFISGENVFGDTAILEFAATDKTSIENVVFKIDGAILEIISKNFDTIAIPIDTTEYINGEHTITAIGTDMGLGNESTTDFIILIDNAPPVVTITSNTLTNQIAYTIEGTATDEGAGVAAFSLGLTATSLKAAAINVLGEFAKEITLTAGVNTIYYEVIDNKGKTFTGTTTIDCDRQSAYMTTGNLHCSNPRFISDSGNVYTPERLNDTNEDDPLYIHYTMVTLDDTEMEVSALNDAGYAYFRIQVYDSPSGYGDNIVKTAPADLRFQMRYKQGPSVILDWHDITAKLCTAGLSDVFVLVPLCDEVLGETWSTNESSIHQIEVLATDLAGNSWTKELTFKLKIEQTAITTDSTLLDNIKTIAYGDFVEVQGGTAPYTWSLQSGTLPCDLSLNSSTGEISGDGSTIWCGVGVYPFTVRVTDANGKYDEKGFTIQLVDFVTITAPTQTSYTVTNNDALEFNINATGGYNEFNFAVESGTFPGGMALEHVNDGGSNYGRIYCDLYGVIDQPSPGTFTVTITATDTTDDRINISQTYSFIVEKDIRYSRTKGEESYVWDRGVWFDGVELSIGSWNTKPSWITKTIDGVKWKFSRYPQGKWPNGYKYCKEVYDAYNEYVIGFIYYFEVKRERCPGGICT